jgi:hypothetical protein
LEGRVEVLTLNNNLAQHDAIVGLVEKCLTVKQREADSDMTEWEREIDRLVYELYGLTPAEIKLVEEATK